MSEKENFNLQSRQRRFKAAVVEYAPLPCSDEDEGANYIQKNLSNYEKFVSDASEEGVDLILFPENGLSGTNLGSMSELRFQGFSIFISDHDQVIRRLSSMAESAQLYMVVNLLERSQQQIDESTKYFNTAVAFDREGRIVGRYRKFHLYLEKYRSRPENVDIAYFDTDFGARVGIMVCFDINYPRPAKDLIATHGIDVLALPVAWVDGLPFLTALQYHSGWACSQGVVVMASNIHNPFLEGSVGSGIYSPAGNFKYVRNVDSGSTMITALVDLNSKEVLPPTRIDPHFKIERASFTLYEDFSQYVSVLLESGRHEVSLSQDGFCATLQYDLVDDARLDPTYIFLLRSGTRTFGGGRYKAGIQVCGVLGCYSYDKEKICPKFPPGFETKKIFRSIKLSANFSTDVRPMPVSLSYSLQLLDNLEYDKKFQNGFVLKSRFQLENVYSIALYGRKFDLDS